ncbi:MAG: hybrid sensor histidine kinase/response regulator [Deltaproteobacteria bacterium]|nr:hybrid sensor histidine kinase/response regulator [Deltaproteobacteria bacterium]
MESEAAARLQALAHGTCVRLGRLAGVALADSERIDLVMSTLTEVTSALGASVGAIVLGGNTPALQVTIGEATLAAPGTLTSRRWPGWVAAAAQGGVDHGLLFRWQGAETPPRLPPPELAAMADLLVALLGSRPLPHAASSELQRALSTLLGGVLHELSNPLSYIIGNLDALTTSEMKDANAPQLLADVVTGVQRLTAVVADLRVVATRWSDVGAGAGADLEQAIDGAMQAVMPRFGAGTRISRARSELPWVAGEPARLEQLFTHLVTFACRSAARVAGGAVRVETQVGDDHRIQASIGFDGERLSADGVRRLLDPFNLERPLGAASGLGLWVCERIVAQLGGQLSVEVLPDTTTRLLVALPHARGPRPELPASVTRRLEVLLVDDEEALLRSMARWLADDHVVLTARSGGEALAVLAEHPDVDLVLSDLMMPGGNGAELYQQIARYAPALEPRVRFMTGGGLPPTLAAFAERMAARLHWKPLGLPELSRMLADAAARALPR